MSLKATAWAIGLQIKPSSKKFVLVAFASYSSDDGKTFPLLSSICKFTSLEPDQVEREVLALAADGIMTDTKQVFEGRPIFQLHRDEAPKTVTQQLQEKVLIQVPLNPKKKKRIVEAALADAQKVYDVYPRKVGGARALQSIAKAIQRYNFQIVFDGTKAFASAWKASGKEKEFCAHPSTFFTQDRFTASLEDLGLKPGITGNAPCTYAEVETYIFEKVQDRAQTALWASQWFNHWRKLKWLKDGKVIEWQIVLSAQIAKWRTQAAK